MPTPRKLASRLGRFNLALFALLWFSVVAPPCAMAMAPQPDPARQHLHCPPQACDEVAPGDCDAPGLEPLPAPDKTPWFALPAPTVQAPASASTSTGLEVTPRGRPPVRAGPRVHLVHAQFNE